jgi:hypothetical protein
MRCSGMNELSFMGLWPIHFPLHTVLTYEGIIISDQIDVPFCYVCVYVITFHLSCASDFLLLSAVPS